MEIELKIITFNIYDLSLWFVKNRRQRIEGITRELLKLNPDIICLQESFDVEHRQKINDALSSRYYSTISNKKIATRRIFHKKMDITGGLVVFSKFPIRESVFTPFNRWAHTSFIEFFARKGLLSIILKTPLGPVRVVNTHLTNKVLFLNRAIRKKQFQMVIDLVKNDKKIPTFITGDFNEHNLMADRHYRELITEQGFIEPIHFQGLESMPTYRKDNIYVDTFINRIKGHQQLDYILIGHLNNQAIKKINIKPLYFNPSLSDHDPLLLTLSL